MTVADASRRPASRWRWGAAHGEEHARFGPCECQSSIVCGLSCGLLLRPRQTYRVSDGCCFPTRPEQTRNRRGSGGCTQRKGSTGFSKSLRHCLLPLSLLCARASRHVHQTGCRLSQGRFVFDGASLTTLKCGMMLYYCTNAELLAMFSFHNDSMATTAVPHAFTGGVD